MNQISNLETIQDSILTGSFSDEQFHRFEKFLYYAGCDNVEVKKHFSLEESLFYLLEKLVDFYQESYETFCELYRNAEAFIHYLKNDLSCQVYRVGKNFVTIFTPTA